MPQTLSSKPLRRFHRADPDRGEVLPPFALQLRDRELLKIIYELRLATAEMLQHLLPPLPLSDPHRLALTKAQAGYTAWLESEHQAGRRAIQGRPSRTKRHILERLKKLYHHGYVGRRKLSNNEPILYYLGAAAVPELVGFYGLDHDRALLQTQHTADYFVKHTLMIGRFRAALTRALSSQGAELALWEPEGSFREEVNTTKEPNKPEHIPIIPDANFALHHGQDIHHCFLEIDRGTMTSNRFYKKLRGYLEFHNADLHRNHHIDHFRVLTVTPSEARKEILRAAAKQLPSTHGLYWFASEQKYSTDPRNLLTDIWQTAKNDDWRELCEPKRAPISERP